MLRSYFEGYRLLSLDFIAYISQYALSLPASKGIATEKYEL